MSSRKRSSVRAKQSGTYLSRNIKLNKHELRWTRGSRYVHKLLKEYGMQDCRPAPTPMANEDLRHEGREDARPFMEKREAKRCRRAAANVNYWAQDRLDLGVASSNPARSICQPRCGDEVKLQRRIRYSKGRPSF